MVAVPVAEDLDLDVVDPREVALHVEPRIGERGLRLGAGRGKARLELGRSVHHPHASPAAARARLEQQRIADTVGLALRGADVVDTRVRSGHHRDAVRVRGGASYDLVPHQLDGLGRRADEREAVLGATTGEARVLRHEPVAPGAPRRNRCRARRRAGRRPAGSSAPRAADRCTPRGRLGRDGGRRGPRWSTPRPLRGPRLGRPGGSAPRSRRGLRSAPRFMGPESAQLAELTVSSADHRQIPSGVSSSCVRNRSFFLTWRDWFGSSTKQWLSCRTKTTQCHSLLSFL